MMNELTLTCQDEQRRYEVRRQGSNGLDYLEVWDDQDQRTLQLYFLGKAPQNLTAAHIRISGGRRITGIQVVDIRRCPETDPELDDCLIITVDKRGDFSTYTLCLVDLDENGRPTNNPFPGIDPRYACLTFSFKVGCPSDLDCRDTAVCLPTPLEEPDINYLAKDYTTFRQLILDRLALLMPDWQERHVPDIGIALVELLAYTGDYLSYYQDAIATEAYIDTARQRISVRRHARLVDYHMHEGCNARAWVCIHTDTDVELDPEGVSFVTGFNNLLPEGQRVLTWDDLRRIPPDRYEVFEPLVPDATQPVLLYQAHNRMRFYTWGDAECCLPQGATSATLVDGQGSLAEDKNEPSTQTADPKAERTVWEYQRALHLQPGDILIFEEVIGPQTGNPADTDPTRRQAVRLTKVEPALDHLYHQPVLEITWAEEDALRFPLCISGVGPAPECQLLTDISVACGNVILVDHGQRTGPQNLGCVPLERTEVTCDLRCNGSARPSLPILIPGRFHPQLPQTPLTFSQPLWANAPASQLGHQDPRQALPWIRLTSFLDPACAPALPAPPPSPGPPGDDAPGDDEKSDADLRQTNTAVTADTPQTHAPCAPDQEVQWPQEWQAVTDLLGSQAVDYHYVVEIDDNRRAHLRFGDGELGAMPAAHHRFCATYRVGNGPSGNVGAETITHIIFDQLVEGLTLQPRNPLPAQGGTAPETVAETKRFAPHAFRRRLERAITPEDYAHIVMRDFPHKVQRAAAVLRWMGSWYEVLVAVDPRHTEEASPALLGEIAAHLYAYRRIGHDLKVQPAIYVPLDIALEVCVRPGFLRGHVKAALLALFSNRRLPDGRFGFFHPDNLSFAEGIFLSKLVAAAQAVPGVEHVGVSKLQRLFAGPNHEIENGVLPLGPLEVARLDHDPNFPENGRLTLNLRGGR